MIIKRFFAPKLGAIFISIQSCKHTSNINAYSQKNIFYHHRLLLLTNIIIRYFYALFILNAYNTRNSFFLFSYALTTKDRKPYQIFSKQFTFKNVKQSQNKYKILWKYITSIGTNCNTWALLLCWDCYIIIVKKNSVFRCSYYCWNFNYKKI